VQSAYGRRSDWFANILVDPQVEAVVGAERIPARAFVVPAEEARDVLARYVRAHPLYGRAVSWWLGYRGRLGDDRSLTEWLATSFTTVAIRPRPSPRPDGGVILER